MKYPESRFTCTSGIKSLIILKVLLGPLTIQSGSPHPSEHTEDTSVGTGG